MVRQLALCHKANKDAKNHVSIHVCGAVPSISILSDRLLILHLHYSQSAHPDGP